MIKTTRQRRLERDTKYILRRMKVGVILELLAEVIRAEKHSTGRELAAAYLLTLTRRHLAAVLLHTPEDLHGFTGRELANLVRRSEESGAMLPVRDDILAMPATGGPLALPMKGTG